MRGEEARAIRIFLYSSPPIEGVVSVSATVTPTAWVINGRGGGDAVHPDNLADVQRG